MLDSAMVLDTLKFKDGHIFLKEFHAQRTHEALNFKNLKIPIQNIYDCYDEVERNYFSQIRPDQILRLSFPITLTAAKHIQIEMIEKPEFSTNPIVEIIHSSLNPSGIGEQNFKWTTREQWQRLLAKKNPVADDVIAINEKCQITETSRCNIFCFDANAGIAMTPALNSGCIDGVYRRFVLAKKTIEIPDFGQVQLIEKNILVSEIKNYSLFLANSIREVLPARLFLN